MVHYKKTIRRLIREKDRLIAICGKMRNDCNFILIPNEHVDAQMEAKKKIKEAILLLGEAENILRNRSV